MTTIRTVLCCIVHLVYFIWAVYWTTLCLKKTSPFLFLWLLGQMFTDFNNIWPYCSQENLQPNDIFLSYNIQFLYEYYRIEKREILYAFNAASSSCHYASFVELGSGSGWSRVLKLLNVFRNHGLFVYLRVSFSLCC